MDKSAFGLIAYGVALILLGVVGYLSNPKKAKTSLFSGGGMGLLSIILGLFSKIPLVFNLALILILLFSAMLLWRAVISWKLVASGNKSKLFVASLLSVMLFLSLFIVGYLYTIR
ncbi:TMEM14 family protein [Methylacidiphilum caldifontis]|uniref:Uncharacterized protein n=1 Tax=Methylacidiphilum caldifontis TaxID=2795386 RepID=A0A4Y8P6U5_9BACT|nr:TMEM14 family protein [Methylacidiphilum caldifontis]QSR88826.1 hypothetical protein IT6_00500 [Methylacidiphilum caldifontis]TFE65896.1 hypothetical protein A7Q10_02740 [Methylacidiphilum caldifontis]